VEINTDFVKSLKLAAVGKIFPSPEAIDSAVSGLLKERYFSYPISCNRICRSFKI